jgi:hypothetical protein
VGQVVQSVKRLATDWKVRGSIPMGAGFSATNQTGPGDHTASSTMGTGLLPEVKNGRDVTTTPHHVLVPLVIKEYSNNSIPPMGRTACREPQ